MHWSFTRLLSSCLSLYFLLFRSYAQTNPSTFRFEHLTVNEGLSHSDARAVAQDQAGFIWVGTNRGLNRYDGYSLRQYALPVNPHNGISSNRIKVLHVGSDGRLWVGGEHSGLSLYDANHDTFLSFEQQPVPAACQAGAQQLARADVTVLTSDPAGRLWVGTVQDGVFVLTFGAQGQLRQVRQLPPTVGGRPSLLRISGIALDAQGNAWVGTYEAGLQVVRAHGAELLVQPTTLSATPIRALHLDQRGDLWLGTSRQVLWLPAASRQAGHALVAYPLAQEFPLVESLLLDSTGQLWIGTDYGLYVWPAGPRAAVAPPLAAGLPTLFLPQDREPYSISAERIHQIVEDRNQIVWLCSSAGGLNKVDLHQKPFGTLRQPAGSRSALASNYINAIYKEEARHLLWFGTHNGVSSYDLARHTYRNYLTQLVSHHCGVDVSSILGAADGTLWFGTRGQGLVTLTRTGTREQLTTYTTLPDGTDLRSASIEWLAQDPSGCVWVATMYGGLHCFSPAGQHLGAYRTDNSALPTNQFTYLLYDARRQVLWASTHNAGLLKLRPAGGKLQLLAHYKYAPGQVNALGVNYVRPLLLDKRGTLWIGTIGGGLHQLTTDARGHDTLRPCTGQLPETDVESILADDAGNLWIGGTGLYRFTPGTGRYLRYDVADGLQSNAFKIGAATRSRDGLMYFGGINGISYFYPPAIQANRLPTVVQLTGLRIRDRPVAVGTVVNGRVLLPQALTQPQTITLKAAENDFSVEFAALNYGNPQRNRYAYRLPGYLPGWVYPVPGQRTASFANLPAGEYTLQVKASNGEGGWSRQYATMRFRVLAPWWRTWWAYGLYALAALGLVALYRRVEMTQQQLKSRLALEHFQVEKEKELANSKLGFFTNVSHELRTPLTLILGPMEEIIGAPGSVPHLREKMTLMHKQTRKLFHLVNQLLDFSKVEAGHLPLRASYHDAIGFLTDSYRVFEPKAAEQRLRYTLRLPAGPVPLCFDQSKLEVILTNLLSNAFKYTPAGGSVELAARVAGSSAQAARFLPTGRLEDNYLEISVSDQGVGIRSDELAYIFDPYYQASHTDGLRMTGTGIGLSLVKQFAERHGGSIEVASEVGRGTTFWLRLPFGQAHLPPGDLQAPEPNGELEEAPALLEEASAVAPAAKPPTSLGKPRLLVVEDNDEVRQYLQQLFEPDYHVLLAADGLEGWEKAQAQAPHLIISDVMMPRGDGLALCRQLKQHPKTAHIPLLLLTARTAALHELEGTDLGADYYLSKPFNPALLQAKVAGLLRNRLRQREHYQRQTLLEPTEVVVTDADRLFLETVMGVVEKHLTDPEFGVQMLGREMGMSQTMFYLRIKNVTGQTGVEFIRDVRMRRAAQLLAHTKLRVSEVAAQVGVADAKYFRQAFQQVHSLTPSDYAKQHRPNCPEAAAT